MHVAAKVGIGVAVAYVGVALYARATGALGVGPSIAAGTVDMHGKPVDPSAWEIERWKRAAVWPRSLLPSPSVG